MEVVLSLSIVCVYNDPHVREACLDRSISDYAGPLDLEYIAIDNTRHQFSSAGAALNHGVRLASNDVIVMVHQDVILHSIQRLGRAADYFRQKDAWGLLGASGLGIGGGHVGRMRDRVQLIGTNADAPVEVDSLDEVLVMALREKLLAEPLTEEVDLSWHAYAVEYGLRMKALGLKVGALNLGITHNSLSLNVAKLDTAHRRIAALYPKALPVHTTCGTIGTRDPSWRRASIVRKYGWRLRWVQHSVRAAQARRRLPVPVVLSDIREGIDLLRFSDSAPLHLINLDRAGGFAEYSPTGVRLSRRGQPLLASATRSMAELLGLLETLTPCTSVLVADLVMDDLREFDNNPGGVKWVAGLQHGAVWLLGGAATENLPVDWRSARAMPGFGANGTSRLQTS